MFRLISLLGVLLTLIAITSGSLVKFLGLELLNGAMRALPVHLNLAYALAGIPVVLLLMAWWQTRFRVAAFVGAFFLLALVVSQVALGIIILKHPDQPLLLTGHLLLATMLLSMFFWVYLRSRAKISLLSEKSGPANFAHLGIGLLLLQIALGSLVAVNQAGMACTGFPQCNGLWWPQVGYLAFQSSINGFLSGLSPLSFEIQVALNWLHRVGALLCFVLLGWLALRAVLSSYPKPVRNAGLWLSFLLVIQIAIGIAVYQFNLLPTLVVTHTVFAAMVMLPLIAISFYSRYGVEDVQKTTIDVKPDGTLIETKVEAKPVIQQQPIVNAAEVVEEVYFESEPQTLYLRLKSQLKKTRSGLGGLLANLSIGQKGITDELLEEVEASLLMADVGIDVTTKIINRLTQRLERQQLADYTALTTALKEELLAILQPCSKPLVIPKQDNPYVILVVGVNGVGKTTTIGKLAKRLKAQGHSVMLAAGDTFRAAAVEQLQTWGERNDIQVIAQHTGADSASVIFDGIQSAQAKGVDVLIADTAGRLHTKANLMEELKKVKRIMAKLDETAPHEVLLVLDAGTGQNALSQTKQFNESIHLTGLALTKLDGTAKGGVIFALAKQSGIPIRFIGVGESIDDLQDFNAESFIDALFVRD